MQNIIITAGTGFIGSHVVRLFVNKYLEYKIINLNKVAYAEDSTLEREFGFVSKIALREAPTFC
jgi:dTDP-D-glucose 4,6-dehydratase